MTGINSYIQLRRTMWRFQIDLNRGNMNYHRCIIQLQTYLPECCVRGQQEQKKACQFLSPHDQREIF